MAEGSLGSRWDLSHKYSVDIYIYIYISRWPLRGTDTAGHGRENDPAKKKGDMDFVAAQLTRSQHGINRDTADTDTTDTAQRPTH